MKLKYTAATTNSTNTTIMKWDLDPPPRNRREKRAAATALRTGKVKIEERGPEKYVMVLPPARQRPPV